MRIMVIMTNVMASSRCTRSIFLGPRPELYLPIFSSETILMGSKRAFLVDIHPTVRPERWDELNIEQRLLDIRSKYEELLTQPLTMKGRINDIMSRAYLYVEVPPHLEGKALAIFDEYLEVFIELVDNAATVPEDRQKRAFDDFENYHQIVMNHDPAVKLYSMLFGKRGGAERVNDLFFAR
jgi:phycoerythrobilin:ferredoxin oxidoreductase